MSQTTAKRQREFAETEIEFSEALIDLVQSLPKETKSLFIVAADDRWAFIRAFGLTPELRDMVTRFIGEKLSNGSYTPEQIAVGLRGMVEGMREELLKKRGNNGSGESAIR